MPLHYEVANGVWIVWSKNRHAWMAILTVSRRLTHLYLKTNLISVLGLIISQNTRKAAMRAAKASMKYKKVNGESAKICSVAIHFLVLFMNSTHSNKYARCRLWDFTEATIFVSEVALILLVSAFNRTSLNITFNFIIFTRATGIFWQHRRYKGLHLGRYMWLLVQNMGGKADVIETSGGICNDRKTYTNICLKGSSVH